MAKKEFVEEENEEEYEDEEECEEVEEEEDEYEDLDSTELIEMEVKALCREMKKYKRTSQEYMVLSQRLSDLTDAQRNNDESIRERKQAAQIDSQKYAWILPTVCQTMGNIVGQAAVAMIGQRENRKTVNDVLYYEKDGNIMTSKAVGFIQKPRN